jgi:hypothetical protein
MLWPSDASPTLRLTFERFNQLASYQGQLSLQSNVLVENLSGKLIPRASVTVYLMDRNKVRTGSDALNISDLEVGQAAKLAFQVFSVGFRQL